MKKIRNPSDTTLFNWMHDKRVSLAYNDKFHMWEAIYPDGLTERSATPRNAVTRLRGYVQWRDS